MQVKPHPSHHLPPIIIGVAMFMGLITMAVVLGMVIQDRTLYFGLIAFLTLAETVSAFVVIRVMLNKCQCPGCNRVLERDKDAKGYQFPCEACDTVWVSKLGRSREY